MACVSRSRSPAPVQRQLALAAFVSCLLHLASSASSFQPPPPHYPSSAQPLPDDLALPTESSTSSRGGGDDGEGRTCWYTVRIKTSCASLARTTDVVSLAFGDQYRNEVYAAQLGGAGAFERCATDTFKVGGPCGYGVCYLYLRSAGRAGWMPEWVKVDAPRAAGGGSSTFYYGEALPDGVWYGFNRCPHRASSSSSSSSPPSSAAQAL